MRLAKMPQQLIFLTVVGQRQQGKAYNFRSQPADGTLYAFITAGSESPHSRRAGPNVQRMMGQYLEKVDDENKPFPLSIKTENVQSPVYEAASLEL